jgi:hypothetical protein
MRTGLGTKFFGYRSEINGRRRVGNATRPRRMAHNHLFGRRALSGTGGLRQYRRDDEPAAIFHQRVAHEAELGDGT